MSVSIPEFKTDTPNKVKHPLAIIHEVADELSLKTDGKVRGNVLILNPGGANLFRYTFYLVAPSLNDYRDPLFYAWHQEEPYPVSLMEAGGKQTRDAKKFSTPQKFESALTSIFNSQATEQRIYGMLDAIEQTASHR